jgi:DNA repair exonuclease SbcCD ATPase subunit
VPGFYKVFFSSVAILAQGFKHRLRRRLRAPTPAPTPCAHTGAAMNVDMDRVLEKARLTTAAAAAAKAAHAAWVAEKDVDLSNLTHEELEAKMSAAKAATAAAKAARDAFQSGGYGKSAGSGGFGKGSFPYSCKGGKCDEELLEKKHQELEQKYKELEKTHKELEQRMVDEEPLEKKHQKLEMKYQELQKKYKELEQKHQELARPWWKRSAWW